MLRPPPRFAEFFAGIGLIRLGLGNGWECAYANDLDPRKHRMYADHFGDNGTYEIADVRQARAARVAVETVDLATASFPCTDTSLAGGWRGIDGPSSSAVFAFCDLLASAERRPPLVLIENVPGLLRSRGGDDFARLSRSLADLGYLVDPFVLDAALFVPQSRPRVFIVGLSTAFDWSDLIDEASRGDRLFADVPDRGDALLDRLLCRTALSTGWTFVPRPTPSATAWGLADAIDPFQEDADWWDADRVADHLRAMQAPSRSRVDAVCDSGEEVVGTAYRRTRLGRTRLEVRFDMAGCLRTPRGGSARQIVVHVRGGCVRMRWMSPREYARLQGAGDFTINVPASQALFGFGDAVCVPAIRWIDRHILTPAVAHLRGEGDRVAMR